MKQVLRELLGQAVREEWVKWASEQPDAKPSWLIPWEQLDERDQEVDRRLGEAAIRTFIQPILSGYQAAATNEAPGKQDRKTTYAILVQVLAGVIFDKQDPEYQEATRMIKDDEPKEGEEL